MTDPISHSRPPSFGDPFPLGSSRHLFIDDHLIAETDRLEYRRFRPEIQHDRFGFRFATGNEEAPAP